QGCQVLRRRFCARTYAPFARPQRLVSAVPRRHALPTVESKFHTAPAAFTFASKRLACTTGCTYKKRAMSLSKMLRARFCLTIRHVCPIFSRLWIIPVSAQARKELRVGVAGVPATLEPLSAVDGAVPLISRQVFDTLVAYREGSTDVEPSLATRWAVSKD